MALFNSTPILTNKIYLDDDKTTFIKLNANNDLLFNNGSEYKINFDCVHEVSNKIGICNQAPLSTLDIFSTSSQLRLSYDPTKYCEFTVDENKILKLDGHESIDVNSKKIKNVLTPTESTDAVNKSYIDNILAGIPIDILNQITQKHIDILVDLSKIYCFTRTSVTVAKVQEQLTARNKFKIQLPSFMFALSSEFCPIEIGCSVITFKIPQEIFLIEVMASVSKYPVGCKGIKLNIRNSETNCKYLTEDLHVLPNNKSATLKYVDNVNKFSANLIKKNTELTVDINDVGNVFAGTGLKLTLIGI